MSVPARITVVTLGVSDVARASAFYEGLGWTKSSTSQPSTAFFKVAGGGVLALYERALLAEDQGFADQEPSAFRGVALAINLSSAEEVDQVFAEALAAGASTLKAPEQMFWGGYSGQFADPDGHAWEIAHNPHVPLTGAGTLDWPD